MIDIGGPAMLRAAAKNFMQVAPVCSPAQYEPVLAELRETGEISLATRRSLAADRLRAHRRLRGLHHALVRGIGSPSRSRS